MNKPIKKLPLGNLFWLVLTEAGWEMWHKQMPCDSVRSTPVKPEEIIEFLQQEMEVTND